jgi:hypothetical protein
MRRLYLFLAFVGFAVPTYFLGAFLREHGLDLPLLFSLPFANKAATFFTSDLILTAIVFLVYAFVDLRRRKQRNWWMYLLATLLVGPSFSLPLFLYLRERQVEMQIPEDSE